MSNDTEKYFNYKDFMQFSEQFNTDFNIVHIFNKHCFDSVHFQSVYNIQLDNF